MHPVHPLGGALLRYALAALLLLGPALGQAVRPTLPPGELERLLASLGWKYEQTFDWGAVSWKA